jgi:hypothetical protein
MQNSLLLQMAKTPSQKMQKLVQSSGPYLKCKIKIEANEWDLGDAELRRRWE